MNDVIQSAAAKQNLQTANVIKKLTLNLIEKMRKMREAEDYALRFYTRPKLIAR